MAAVTDVRYSRARFVTRLPDDVLYTPSHHWLREVEAGVYQIGLTGFATRMLGDLVEYEFAVAPGDAVTLGRSVGWIEGFKALSDLFCVADGTFVGENAALARQVTLLDRDPCRRGWLYQVRGTADPRAVGVQDYVAVLDATIDRMLAQADAPPEDLPTRRPASNGGPPEEDPQ